MEVLIPYTGVLSFSTAVAGLLFLIMSAIAHVSGDMHVRAFFYKIACVVAFFSSAFTVSFLLLVFGLMK